MKIGIDARFWGPSHTGLGVYTRELIQHLEKIDRTNEYTLLVRNEVKGLLSLQTNFSTTTCEARAYTFKEQLLVPWKLYQGKFDIVHFPSINVPILYFGNYIVTVHDLIKHVSRGVDTTTHHPFVYWVKYLLYRIIFWILLKRSVGILVPSKSVRDELVRAYPFVKNKVKVTYESAVLDNKNKQLHLSLPEKFAIYTGNAYPHKNIERLISVWEEVYKQTNVPLIISSGRSVFTNKIEGLIRKSHAERFVKYCGYLSDEELSSAYKKATIYVFPSLLEGFGIPGLDAMRHGLPVVCSNIPVLKEIYGDAAEYFDPTDAQSISDTIVDVLKDKKRREQLIKKGYDRVKEYSWDKTAKETLVMYEKFKK